jgi:Flp pilus assembly protein TadG
MGTCIDSSRPALRRLATRWSATGRARREGAGAVVVEFALVFPMLMMILFGIITAGLSYTHAVGLTNAVREGARFGAVSDASPTMASQWADDVIARVRETQFDDTTQESQICVQLWKVGTGAIANTGKCSSTGGASYISLPTTASQDPAVPSNATGSCVVRVLAARPFNIFIGISGWDSVKVTGSVERYERKDKVTSCS